METYEEELKKYKDVYDLWMEHQATVKTVLLALIQERYQTRLIMFKTAKEMWNELTQNFKKQSDLVKSDLFLNLVNLRTPKGGNVTDTINKLLHSYNDYCTAGGVLEMNQLALILITAVPKDYHSTINAMITMASITKQELTFEMVTNSIMEAVKLNDKANKQENDKLKVMIA
jgi:gag-polypeptide of LTR copia-type